VSRLPELPDRYNVPGARQPERSTTRIPALDGLRGVAIAGVVAFHTGILRGGFLGVDLFFVLSGFLIAGILLREHDALGTTSLANFWTRRARRLVPAVLALIAAAQIWAHARAPAADLPVLNGQSVAALAYVSNWYNIFFHVGYWSAGLSRSPLNHLWSLGIEEQFYLLFPLLVLVLFKLRASSRTIATVFIALAFTSFLLTPFVAAAYGANRAYFGTDTRAGAILLGAALASLFRISGATTAVDSEQVGAAIVTGLRSAASAIAFAGSAVILALWLVAETSSGWLYRGGLLAHAVASVCIIASVVVAPRAVLARVLSWEPLVWLGERSYSLYLWHWPLLVVMTPAATGLHGGGLAVVVFVAICVATILSYELIEYPIRYSQLRGVRLATSLVLPAVGVACAAIFFQPAPPPQFGSNTLFTQGRGPLRLMIVGDSWARNMGLAMAEVDSSHHTTIVNMGKGGCGIADAKRERSPEEGEFATSPDCLTWSVMWPAVLQSVRPQAAVLMVGTWDLAEQDFAGTGAFVGACDPAFRTNYSRQLDSAISVLRSHDAEVFVATIRDNDARAGSPPDCMNTLVREAVARHAANHVHLLDMYAQLCANHRCADTVNGEAVYDASGHLATEAQRRIATWVLNRVNSVARMDVP
jgi:peptidoglycan/LPS O-acetylase OafA/YrhL